jgi:hypothetical protein
LRSRRVCGSSSMKKRVTVAHAQGTYEQDYFQHVITYCKSLSVPPAGKLSDRVGGRAHILNVADGH